jgi:hypothetical protein
MEDRQDRATVLRRRIDLYRSYLKKGADTERACEYLRQIMADQAELERVDEVARAAECGPNGSSE